MNKYSLYMVDRRMRTNLGGLPGSMHISEKKVSFSTIYNGETTINDIMWFVLSAGKYHIYEVTNEDGRIIHRSKVIGRCLKFPFLPKGAYEIGPCLTEEDFRGKGIYPKVLTHICSVFRSDLYMIIRDDNYSSIRGVEKAGFVKVGAGYRDRFGIWRMKQNELEIL